jgi:hypothetical protein
MVHNFDDVFLKNIIGIYFVYKVKYWSLSNKSLRNPGHADQGFRMMPITNSGACRSCFPGMAITGERGTNAG